MAEIINLNNTSPAAPSDSKNVEWQKGTQTGTDPASGYGIFPVSAYMSDMVGDAGSGGVDGLVPAPPAGSAAAGKFLKADGTWATTSGLVIGFVINTGTPGTNVGPMLAAPRTATLSSVVVVTKSADATTPFQFDIKKNGVSIFTGTLPTVSAGTSQGSVSTFTSLTSVPLNVTKSDVFSIDIIQGTPSWITVVQAEA